MSGKAAKITVTERQFDLLQEFAASRSCAVSLSQRSKIILLGFEGRRNDQIAELVGLHADNVGVWRRRWRDQWEWLTRIECSGTSAELREAVIRTLSDEPRSGRPPAIDAEQQTKIAKTACEPPASSGRPIARWTREELAAELVDQKIVESISARWVGKLLQRLAIRPHKNKYWLNSKDKRDPDFDSRVAAVCDAYRNAIDLYDERGIHTICIDEQTGIQALARIHPDKPLQPGMLERREYEYKRHGTTCLFGNFHVATGKLLAPMLQQTRTEEDFLENIDAVVSLDPGAGYRFVMDNLNTHNSESCVRYVATTCGIDEDLGVKGRRGILKSVKSRATFLTDPAHRIQFLYVPRHTSWLNQVEIWFGTLRRKVTRLMSFASLDALEEGILSFIDYYNATLAHPYNWTYSGRVLAK